MSELRWKHREVPCVVALAPLVHFLAVGFKNTCYQRLASATFLYKKGNSKFITKLRLSLLEIAQGAKSISIGQRPVK